MYTDSHTCTSHTSPYDSAPNQMTYCGLSQSIWDNITEATIAIVIWKEKEKEMDFHFCWTREHLNVFLLF